MPNSSVVLVYWFFALLVCINIKNLSSDYCPDTVPGLLYVSAVLDSTLYFRSPIPGHEIHVNVHQSISVDNTHVAYPVDHIWCTDPCYVVGHWGLFLYWIPSWMHWINPITLISWLWFSVLAVDMRFSCHFLQFVPAVTVLVYMLCSVLYFVRLVFVYYCTKRSLSSHSHNNTVLIPLTF